MDKQDEEGTLATVLRDAMQVKKLAKDAKIFSALRAELNAKFCNATGQK